MFANFQYILQHNCQIALNKPVLMGVSGGPDSLCLLDLFWQLGCPVIVAHLNHGLRPTAEAEVEIVRRETSARNLPLLYQKMNVLDYAKKHRMSIEDAARSVRYQFLFELARQTGAQAVAVGHNADDQVETILMHLLRGSGIIGLRGMQYRLLPNNWDAEIPLIRPLLGYWREDIYQYLEERGIKPALDESNLELDYFRNRVRLELIPYLQKYNPQIKKAIFRMGDILGNEYEIVEKSVNFAWDECCVSQGVKYVCFDLVRLSDQPRGVLRHLIRRGIGFIRNSLRNLDYDQIERVIDFIDTPNAKRTIINDMSVLIEGKLLWLAASDADLPLDDLPQLAENQVYWLDVPGYCYLPKGWVFRAEAVDVDALGKFSPEENRDAYEVWVDAERLSNRIELRGRKPGDRFQPLGMTHGSIKISDFMINQKIPQRARDLYPLVISAGEIVWIPGYRLGRSVKITPESKHIIRLYLKRDVGE